MVNAVILINTATFLTTKFLDLLIRRNFYDEISYDEISYDEISYDEISDDESSGDGSSGDENSGDESSASLVPHIKKRLSVRVLELHRQCGSHQ